MPKKSGEFTMGQVVKRTGVSKSTLVRWEVKGIPTPTPKRRARTKARIYTEEHIRQIEEERDRELDDDGGKQ